MLLPGLVLNISRIGYWLVSSISGKCDWVRNWVKGKFVLFNDASRTHWFSYHQLLEIKHMVIVTYFFRGNLPSPHRLLFVIRSKGFCICSFPQTGEHIPQPVMDHLFGTENSPKAQEKLGHDSGSLVSQWGSIIISLWVCALTSRCPSGYNHTTLINKDFICEKSDSIRHTLYAVRHIQITMAIHYYYISRSWVVWGVRIEI